MRRRVALLTGLVVAGLAGPHAGAAACPLLSDPRDDENRAWLDIVSADLDVQPGAVVATIRMRDLAGADPTRAWSVWVDFRPARAAHVDQLIASVGPSGATFRAYRNADDLAALPQRDLGEAQGTVDPATGLVTVTVPRATFGGDVAGGAQLSVTAGTALGVGGVLTAGADDTGPATLVVGRRRCPAVRR